MELVTNTMTEATRIGTINDVTGTMGAMLRGPPSKAATD